MPTVQESITEITEALHVVERKLNKLHNALAQALADHGELLGLTGDEITAAGGGTNKPAQS